MRKSKASIELRRRMRLMLIFLGILFGCIFLYKGVMSLILHHAISSQSNMVTVSTMKVDSSQWNSQLKAVGSLRAIRGVNVSGELAGIIRHIDFTPGTFVNEGTELIELNIDPDMADLRALEATAELNQITYERDEAQYRIKAISKAVLDTDSANLKNSLAQVEQQNAIIEKKIIRAPFSGRLGISSVNPGQFLNPGDTIVSLQQLDPIYVDFYVPQQQVSALGINQEITLETDALPGKTFSGKITTINPIIDSTTRNVEVEATMSNPDLALLPGMFGTVIINTGNPQGFITVPQTAIAFNPYGNIVFLVNDEQGSKNLTVKQVFVKTGETRGEQIAVVSGLNKGDEIVTSGQLKLKNGSEIVVNNKITPSDNPNPDLSNEH